MGDYVRPILTKRLLAGDWSKVEDPLKLKLFSVLFMLLHEISENASGEAARAILRAPCNPQISSEIKRILSHSKKDFVSFKLAGVMVYQSRQLRPRWLIRRLISKWLSLVPREHLSGINLLYVMPEGGCGSDIAGQYSMQFGRICLAWDKRLRFINPLDWMIGRVLVGQTLFHEIGHHVLGHGSGAREDDKEQAADEYSNELMVFTSGFWKVVAPLRHHIRTKWFRRKQDTYEWLELVKQHWINDKARLRAGASKDAIEHFEQINNLKLPKQLRLFLEYADGMESSNFCGGGFHFRNLDEIEVVERGRTNGNQKPQKYLKVADHFPSKTHYLLSVKSLNIDMSAVLRSGCFTEDGYLEIAFSFSIFLNKYRKGRALLFA